MAGLSRNRIVFSMFAVFVDNQTSENDRQQDGYNRITYLLRPPGEACQQGGRQRSGNEKICFDPSGFFEIEKYDDDVRWKGPGDIEIVAADIIHAKDPDIGHDDSDKPYKSKINDIENHSGLYGLWILPRGIEYEGQEKKAPENHGRSEKGFFGRRRGIGEQDILL